MVHFPIAFYIGALGLDVLSRIGTFPFAPTAATWLIAAAIVGSAAAATTGLVDRSTMKPGSRVRTMATRHMLFQYAALFDSLTVEENVAFPLVEHTAKHKEENLSDKPFEVLVVELKS